MNLTRYLRAKLIDLDHQPDLPEFDSDSDIAEEKRLWRTKEAVLKSLAQLLSDSGRVGKEKKLYQDLLFREKKASTAIGLGVAIPHIRTMQAKELVIGVAVVREGVEFDAIDGDLVRVFCPIVTPPYEDRTYLRVLKRLAEFFSSEALRDELLDLEDPGEVIRLLSSSW